MPSRPDHRSPSRRDPEPARPGTIPGADEFEHGVFADEFDSAPDDDFLDDVAGEADDESRDAELAELEAVDADKPSPARPDRRHTDRPSSRPGPRAVTSDDADRDTPDWSQPGVIDRRLGLDRRAMDDAKNGKKTDLNRRRGPGRRLSDFTRSAEEGEMTPEQFLFLQAIDGFKKANNKFYPSWTDVLEVIRLLGYRKTMPNELDLPDVEDWREPANAAAGVRPVRPEDRAAKKNPQKDPRKDKTKKAA